MTGGPTSGRERFRRATDDEFRGLVDVDHAVRRFRRGVIRPVHVSPELAEQLGWPLCACGEGGIRPGACVIYRRKAWHVECALVAAAELASPRWAAA